MDGGSLLIIVECKAVRAGSLRGTRKTAANGISRVSGTSGNHPNLNLNAMAKPPDDGL